MDQRDEVVRGEGELEGAHLVEDAAEAPHVGLVVVRLPPADLGRAGVSILFRELVFFHK